MTGLGMDGHVLIRCPWCRKVIKFDKDVEIEDVRCPNPRCQSRMYASGLARRDIRAQFRAAWTDADQYVDLMDKYGAHEEGRHIVIPLHEVVLDKREMAY